MQRLGPLVDAVEEAFYSKPGDGGESLIDWTKVLVKKFISPTTSVHDVEEIIGDALVKIARMAQANRPALDIANVIPKVMRTTAINYFERSNRADIGLPDRETDLAAPDPADELGAREAVRNVIFSLTERDRALLKMRINGWSYVQIAAFFESTSDSRATVDALTVALSRIVRRLRDAAERS